MLDNGCFGVAVVAEPVFQSAQNLLGVPAGCPDQEHLPEALLVGQVPRSQALFDALVRDVHAGLFGSRMACAGVVTLGPFADARMYRECSVYFFGRQWRCGVGDGVAKGPVVGERSVP